MTYQGIHIEGDILSQPVLEEVAAAKVAGQRPEDFGLKAADHLPDRIAAEWLTALTYWQYFTRRRERLPASESPTTLTRSVWMVPLLHDVLGYTELVACKESAQVGGQRYFISHRAGPDESAPPVHIEGFETGLDDRAASGRRFSPHVLVQEYLNRTEHLWGLVSNGLKLRLLRQNSRTTQPSYIEFDLQTIFEGRHFEAFAVLYRLAHRTRLPRNAAEGPSCLLEQYHVRSVEEGHRIRDRLRDGVEEALRTFGNGFLRHPANQELRQALVGGKLSAADYYRQLLRLVYRMLFLLVAEERQVLLRSGDSASRAARIYMEHYSMQSLRRRAERRFEESVYGDLWLGLLQTFRLFRGTEQAGLPVAPLDGELFGAEAIPDLEACRLFNHDLLAAVRALTEYQHEGRRRRVNYAALDVEELGSVYESLLDYHPVVHQPPAVGAAEPELRFELVWGSERKSTGSYYTPRPLVDELIASALVPVIEARLQGKTTKEERRAALLSIRVVDPATGSGHFLLAAARRLGLELARIESEQDLPPVRVLRKATREVIRHCIYGVDVNPLAVELCKFGLWLESHDPDEPLCFLDHRIRCGNSLVGVFRLDVLGDGVPAETYKPVFGDAKDVARIVRQQNDREGKDLAANQGHLAFGEWLRAEATEWVAAWKAFAELPEDTVEARQRKAQRFRELTQQGSTERLYLAANLWTAAFFVPLTREFLGRIPTTRDVTLALGGQKPDDEVIDQASSLNRDLHFFHWPLEFPEVFEAGGFDVVLGNPPWERIKLQEEEFFAGRDPEIARAPNKAERQRLIAALATTNPTLYSAFGQAKHRHEAESRFVRAGGRFPLTAVGDTNTYALFSELARALLNPEGRAGIIVPTGIATDYTNRGFFAKLLDDRALASLYDFENRKGLFPAIDSRMKFALLTISLKPVTSARAVFFATDVQDLRDGRRLMELTPEDLRRVNPNTGTCAVFRTRQDAELTTAIYRRVPILVDRRTGHNPWGVSFLRMFDMSNDSDLFRTAEQLKQEGFVRNGATFVKGDAVYVPLYEGKTFEAYNHRAAGTVLKEHNVKRSNQPLASSEEQLRDPFFEPEPLWWVPSDQVKVRLENWSYNWLVVLKNVTSATNSRTVVATIMPYGGVGHSASVVIGARPAADWTLLLGNLNALVFDYIARQKVAGLNLSWYLVEQLPVIPPSRYSKRDVEFITRRVLELTYTSFGLMTFSEDLGYPGIPFTWDESRRAVLRAELDAYYAHLYGLTRDELRYILDPQDVYGPDFPGETFRVLKTNEMKQFGEYRTARLVLEAYDRLAGQVQPVRVEAMAG